MPSNNQRFIFLDSIRGIAALAVVLCHCWLLNSTDFKTAHYGMASATSVANFLLYCLSKLHESGRSAVMIFFVLSGFVLAYSLQKKSMPYFSYVIKRVFRFYPAFAFAILASYTMHRFLDPLLSGANVIPRGLNTDSETHDLSLGTLVKHLALWGTTGNRWLDYVIWSLVHEMRISLVFPLILFSVMRYEWRSILGYWLFSILCSMSLLSMTGTVALGYEEDTFAETFLDTGFFAVFFAAGAYLALNREWVAHKIAGTATWIRMVLFVAVAYCLLKTNYNNHSSLGSVVDYLRGIGAIGLISLALGSKKFSKILSHKGFTWLGRISYSLYLIHVVIIYVIINTVGESWSVLQASIVVIALSLAIGEVMARFIELPFIEMGKRFYIKKNTFSGDTK